MTNDELRKLDRRELKARLEASYETLSELSQNITREHQMIRTLEGLLHNIKFDKNDPENILTSKIHARLREKNKLVADLNHIMANRNHLYAKKSEELREKNYSPAEIDKILDKPDHCEALAKIAFLENEESILCSYLEFIRLVLTEY